MLGRPLRFVVSSVLPEREIVFEYSNPHIIQLLVSHDLGSGSPPPFLELPPGTLTLCYCEQLLTELLKQKELAPFYKGVNPHKDAAKDYYDIIKHPMDLSTLQQQLLSGYIADVDDFKRNLDLIWTNCVVYNGEQSPLGKLAISMNRGLRRLWEALERPPKAKVSNELKELVEVLDSLKGNLDVLNPSEPRPAIEPLQVPKKAMAEKKQPVREPVEELPPTFPQRIKIAQKLSSLPYQGNQRIWDMIAPHVDAEARDLQELRIDKLPKEVLIELKRSLLGM